MKTLESPKRKQQKQNDYQRHKLLRKIKKRRQSRMNTIVNGGIPKYEDGKDTTNSVSNGRTIQQMKDEEAMLSQLPADRAEGSYRNILRSRQMTDEDKQNLYTYAQMVNAQQQASHVGQYISNGLDGLADIALMIPHPLTNLYARTYYGAKGAKHFYDGNLLEGAIDTGAAFMPASFGPNKLMRSAPIRVM